VRNVVIRFGSSPAFARALREGDQELPLPAGESVQDGEWVLAMFEIGEKRRATASAARGLVRGPGEPVLLSFERRDWERLVNFAEAGSIPPSPPPAPRDAGRTAPWGPRAPFKAGTSPARILVVDDEPEVCEIVGAMLEAVGLVVQTVRSGEDAFELVRRQACDLLVLDWNLPGMTGLDLCRLVRKEPVGATLPILFLSAHASSQDVVEAFASGADDYVTKPFRAPELGARIFGLLRRARIAASGA
jgi:two-component system phosphate regulon response regulator PhoB